MPEEIKKTEGQDFAPGTSAETQKRRTSPRALSESRSAAQSRRPKKDASELKFEAIRALSNLPDDSKFFLIIGSADSKQLSTINNWN